MTTTFATINSNWKLNYATFVYIFIRLYFTIFIENRITLFSLNKSSLVPKKLSLPPSLKKKKYQDPRNGKRRTIPALKKKEDNSKNPYALNNKLSFVLQRNFLRDLPHKFTFYRALITISGRKRVECSTEHREKQATVHRYNSRR